MRYYEIRIPNEKEPQIATSLRGIKNLPEGTRIVAIVTERDGTLADSWDVPIVNGKPSKYKGKDSTSYIPHL